MYCVTNVKIDSRKSDETLCFSAEIRTRKDGELVALVSNRGRGGCHSYAYSETADRAAFLAYAAVQGQALFDRDMAAVPDEDGILVPGMPISEPEDYFVSALINSVRPARRARK